MTSARLVKAIREKCGITGQTRPEAWFQFNATPKGDAWITDGFVLWKAEGSRRPRVYDHRVEKEPLKLETAEGRNAGFAACLEKWFGDGVFGPAEIADGRRDTSRSDWKDCYTALLRTPCGLEAHIEAHRLILAVRYSNADSLWLGKPNMPVALKRDGEIVGAIHRLTWSCFSKYPEFAASDSGSN